MKKNYTSRLEVLLAKIAGNEASLETMVPPWPANLSEKLMVDIADRLNGVANATVPEVSNNDKGKYLHSNAETGAVEWAAGGGGGGSDLPVVTSSDNGKVLGVVDGEWGPSVAGFIEKTTVTTVLPETTITSADQSGAYMAMVQCAYVPTDGEELVVTFNGTAYNMTANGLAPGVVGVGDFNPDTMLFDFSRYPFGMGWSEEAAPGYIMVFTASASTNTIKIDAPALVVSDITPGFVKAVTSVNQLTTDVGESVATLSKTAQEIIDMCDAGLPVITYTSGVSGSTTARTAWILTQATTDLEGVYTFTFYDMADEAPAVFGAINPDAYPQAPFKIPFTIDDTTYYHDPGSVSWSTWVNSEDNTDGFYIDNRHSVVLTSDGSYCVTFPDGPEVLIDTGIGVNMHYITQPFESTM